MLPLLKYILSYLITMLQYKLGQYKPCYDQHPHRACQVKRGRKTKSIQLAWFPSYKTLTLKFKEMTKCLIIFQYFIWLSILSWKIPDKYLVPDSNVSNSTLLLNTMLQYNLGQYKPCYDQHPHRACQVKRGRKTKSIQLAPTCGRE